MGPAPPRSFAPRSECIGCAMAGEASWKPGKTFATRGSIWTKSLLRSARPIFITSSKSPPRSPKTWPTDPMLFRTPKDKRDTARAFTLVELLVAITAGLFVSIAAFSLAKQGSRFFQQEARIANTQFSAVLGFDRLRADIARAGYMSTANISRDPFRCGDLTQFPPGMTGLASIRL